MSIASATTFGTVMSMLPWQQPPLLTVIVKQCYQSYLFRVIQIIDTILKDQPNHQPPPNIKP